MKVIAIDFDGTLCKDGGLNVQLKTLLDEEWDKQGSFLVLHTARPESHREYLTSWLDSHGVRVHAIVCDKLPATIYIDDKSVTLETLTGENQ